LEGATSLNALDYHAEMIRFPAGNTFRDIGIQARGLLADDLVHYRLAIFNGVRNAAAPATTPPSSAVNNMGLPRVTGHVRFNLMGSEPDFFFKGIYFSTTPIVTVGVGADFQPNSQLRASGARRNYFGASFDIFAEYPFSADDEIIFKANLFYWAVGSSTLPASSPRRQGAIAGYVEAGYRHDWIEPLAFVEYSSEPSDEPGARSILAPHLGVNFWAMKHAFNVKTDLGYRVMRNKQPIAPATSIAPAVRDIFWTTQGQVIF
jgi:hypothetical protein